MALDFSYQHNAQNQEALGAISVSSPYFSSKDNEFYVSPKEILLSVPFVYSDHKYISIDPKTFADDWNASEYGSYSSPISEDINIPEIISSYFGVSTDLASSSDQSSDYFVPIRKELDTLSKEFEDSIDFSYIGEDETEFELHAKIDNHELEDFISSIVDVMEDNLHELLIASGSTQLLTASYQYGYEMEIMFDSLREVVIEEDINVSFFINRKSLQLTRVIVENFVITTESMIEYEESVEVAFDLTLNGKEHLLDDLICKVDLTFVDTYYETPERDTISFLLTHTKADTKGIELSNWEVLMSADNQRITLYSDFSWDKQMKTDENMSFELGMKSSSGYSERYALRLDGNLEEKSGKIILSEGIISLLDGRKSLLELNLDYSMEELSNKSFRPSTKDTVDFFGVDWEEISNRLYSLLY